jgi:hypothetical protein
VCFVPPNEDAIDDSFGFAVDREEEEEMPLLVDWLDGSGELVIEEVILGGDRF